MSLIVSPTAFLHVTHDVPSGVTNSISLGYTKPLLAEELYDRQASS